MGPEEGSNQKGLGGRTTEINVRDRADGDCASSEKGYQGIVVGEEK